MKERKFTPEECHQAMVLAWQIRKSTAVKHNCKLSEIIFSECLKLAYSRIFENNMPDMDFSAWYDHYTTNIKTFDYILFKQNILTKNGKITLSQELENQTTTAFYQITFGEIEDIKQTILLKIKEYINRRGNIPYKYRYNIYNLLARNTIILHVKAKKRYNMAINPGELSPHGYDNGQRIALAEDDQGISLLKLTLQEILTEKEYKIIIMTSEGYTQEEIAANMGISRQWVIQLRDRARVKIVNAGLYPKRKSA